MTPTGQGAGAVQVALCGEPLRDFSMALVVDRAGAVILESDYSPQYTVSWLIDHIRKAADEGDADFPHADKDGDWSVIVTGADELDAALIMVAYDNGWLAAGCLPGARGQAWDQDAVLAILRGLQADTLQDLLDDDTGGTG